MRKEKCLKCSHEWLPRVENPTECPNCKRRDWKGLMSSKEGLF